MKTLEKHIPLILAVVVVVVLILKGSIELALWILLFAWLIL